MFAGVIAIFNVKSGFCFRFVQIKDISNKSIHEKVKDKKKSNIV